MSMTDPDFDDIDAMRVADDYTKYGKTPVQLVLELEEIVRLPEFRRIWPVQQRAAKEALCELKQMQIRIGRVADIVEEVGEEINEVRAHDATIREGLKGNG
jgi:hypothetical protein